MISTKKLLYKVVEAIDGVRNKLYPVGSIYTTTTNENPESYLGGTWKLIDKEYKRGFFGSYTGTEVFTNSNCSAWSITYSRSGGSIWIRCLLTPKIALSDTEVTLGTLKIEELGATGIGNQYICGYSDAGNAIAMLSIGNDGTIKVVDAVNVSGTHAIASGSQIVFSFVAINSFSGMIDDECGKFVWERTE